jgi:hypothetical protein
MPNVPTPNLKVISLNGQVTATGQVVLYTVPPGKKALFFYGSIFNNSGINGGPFNIGWFVQPENFFMQTLTPIATVVNNNTATFASTSILEFYAQAGDQFVTNFTQQPYYLRAAIIEFDDTSPIFSARFDLTALLAQDFTLFTCPQGKSAILGISGTVNLSTNSRLLSLYNVSGAAKTINFYIIPTGKVKDSTTQINTQQSVGVAPQFQLTLQTATAFNPGDKFVINVDTGAGGLFAMFTGILY